MQINETLRLAGFEINQDDRRVHYLTPRPRKRLWNVKEVESYLVKQHASGRLLNIDTKMFSFVKRKSQGGGHGQGGGH